MTQHNRETLLALADRYCEALTPSTATKVAYIGEFSFTVEDCDEDGEHFTRRVYVPWDTTKQIMAAIRARATLDPTGEKA